MCVLALGGALVSGCGQNPRENNASREGLPERVGGIDYNVYITRELNLRDAEDRSYYKGPEAPPGYALYGMFLTVCNDGQGFRTPLTSFTVEDNQGNRFHPLPVSKNNDFAYRARRLSHNACIPEPGSAASFGPTSGALLVFKFPVSSLENRPLELLIQNRAAPFATPQTKRVELDI